MKSSRFLKSYSIVKIVLTSIGKKLIKITSLQWWWNAIKLWSEWKCKCDNSSNINVLHQRNNFYFYFYFYNKRKDDQQTVTYYSNYDLSNYTWGWFELLMSLYINQRMHVRLYIHTTQKKFTFSLFFFDWGWLWYIE